MTRYIDAYALRDKVIESEKNNPHTDGIVRKTHNHEHEHFLKMIADEPTADVQEVKHGEWRLLEECSNEGVYCSVCHKKSVQEGLCKSKVKIKLLPELRCKNGRRCRQWLMQ